MTEPEEVSTQVIANLVVRNPNGEVLFVRYDPENEKWWLPGGDVEPYSHPDEAAAKIIRQIDGVEASACALNYVDSFRGRRGWHLVFNYDVSADGSPGGPNEARWFAPDDLPRTMHGNWEKQVVATVLDTERTP